MFFWGISQCSSKFLAGGFDREGYFSSVGNLGPGRKDLDSIKRVVSTPAVYPGTCDRRGKICK